MLGQPAASQTVCRPSRRTSPLSSRNDGPMVALVRIHGGLRSMGIWLLRISRRSSLRPPGPDAGVLTNATLRGIRRYTGELRCACPEQSGGVLVAGSQARRHPAGGFTSLPEAPRLVGPKYSQLRTSAAVAAYTCGSAPATTLWLISLLPHLASSGRDPAGASEWCWALVRWRRCREGRRDEVPPGGPGPPVKLEGEQQGRPFRRAVGGGRVVQAALEVEVVDI